MRRSERAAAAAACAVWLWGGAASGLAVAGEKPKPDKEGKEDQKEKPFAELVKGAKEIKGLFTIYRAEDKTYLELGPEQLDKVVYVALTLESGIGERGFYASQVGGMAPLLFHREGKAVQLVRKNTRFMARSGSPIERAVVRSFSDSIIGAASVEVPAAPGAQERARRPGGASPDRPSGPGVGPRGDVPRPLRSRRQGKPLRDHRRVPEERRSRDRPPLRGGEAAGPTAADAGPAPAADAAAAPQPPGRPEHGPQAALQLRRAAARRLPAEARRRPCGALPRGPGRLQRRHGLLADAALHRPLAAREAGPSGARSRRPSSRSSSGSRTRSREKYRAAVRDGVLLWNQRLRADRLPGRRSWSSSSPTTPTGTRPTSATPRSAGSRRATPSSPSARRTPTP